MNSPFSFINNLIHAISVKLSGTFPRLTWVGTREGLIIITQTPSLRFGIGGLPFTVPGFGERIGTGNRNWQAAGASPVDRRNACLRCVG
jgi:hypothetical protein